jgi:hypothetical protein
MTIQQLNELLMERDELRQQIRIAQAALPPVVCRALAHPEAIDYARMLDRLQNLNYLIEDAEKQLHLTPPAPGSL